MARMLEDFVTEADSVFHGRFVLKQHRQAVPTTRPVELLAQYLVAELHDLYDPMSSDSENLHRFVSNLEFASARLEDVVRCFRELLAEESLAEAGSNPSRAVSLTSPAE